MTEKWTPVFGMETLFEVSTSGRIRSFDSIIKHPTGNRIRRGKVLSQSTIKRKGKVAYKKISLSKNGERKGYLVHRLILESFIGPCPLGMEARHFPDSDPSNNNLHNLSWSTPKQNSRDRITHGTDCSGERNGRTKLKWDDVKSIRRRHKKGERTSDLAREYNMDRSTMGNIVNFITWRKSGKT